MFETKPRRIASSAISRWLQWLIGRSLSDGFSQVIAITAQICSGVYVAGAPERGASASRSGTDWAGGACRAHSTSQQLALRIRIILQAADDVGVRESARELDVWPKTVRYWRGRWIGDIDAEARDDL